MEKKSVFFLFLALRVIARHEAIQRANFIFWIATLRSQ